MPPSYHDPHSCLIDAGKSKAIRSLFSEGSFNSCNMSNLTFTFPGSKDKIIQVLCVSVELYMHLFLFKHWFIHTRFLGYIQVFVLVNSLNLSIGTSLQLGWSASLGQELQTQTGTISWKEIYDLEGKWSEQDAEHDLWFRSYFLSVYIVYQSIYQELE